MKKLNVFIRGLICLALSLPLVLILQSGAAHADADGDGIPDILDNCVNVYNPDQADSDGALANVALNKSAWASGTWQTNFPERAIDGDPLTAWNAGGWVPQWIVIDLGAPHAVSGMSLIVAQSPAGNTVHNIYVSADNVSWTLAATLSQFTNNQNILTVDFNPPLENTQYVKVESTISPSWIAWWEIEVFAHTGDGVGDACDNCRFAVNPLQEDSNLNCPAPPYVSDPQCGDGCEVVVDADGDGFFSDVDCDDLDPSVYPGAVELCDGKDNDCDGTADNNFVPTPTNCGLDLCSNEGALDCINGQLVDTCQELPPTTVYYEGDGDGYGDSSNTLDVCTVPQFYLFVGGDCDDTDPTVNPGASDICDANHIVINKDCDPSNDSSLDCFDFCGDADADGYVTTAQWDSWGGEIPSAICPWIVDKGDCNDSDAAINPLAVEVCDGVDNNCDGQVDEGCPAADQEKALETIEQMSSTDEDSQRKIAEAKKAMKKSLGNRHPEGDKKIIWYKSDRLARKHGHKAYQYQKKAVDKLEKIKEEALKEKAKKAKEYIESGARKLAEKAVEEMPAGKDKDKAREKYEKGLAEIEYKKKMQRYKSAWKYANKTDPAKGADETSCIEEISLLSPAGDTVTEIGDSIDHKRTVFTDIYDNKLVLDTSCLKCIFVGQVIRGWTITDIVDDGTLATVCAN